TTDEDFVGDPAAPTVEPRDITYLCDVVNGYFRQATSPADAVWAFAGVRALYDDGAWRAEDTTRDYLLTVDLGAGEAPLLTVYGGKITPYRVLAQDALAKLARFFAPAPPWTGQWTLPGGDFAPGGEDALAVEARRKWPFLSDGHVRRLIAAYG